MKYEGIILMKILLIGLQRYQWGTTAHFVMLKNHNFNLSSAFETKH